ncbi:hypothetical protein M5689_024397 [Euphorbia peplus]|nr:hypothetical protein M5689_024397 [Euphorbia peplus]
MFLTRSNGNVDNIGVEISSPGPKGTQPPTQGPISLVASSPNQKSLVRFHLKSPPADSPPFLINHRPQPHVVRISAPSLDSMRTSSLGG